MIRHVALFRFKPEFSTDQRQQWIEIIRDLPQQIPGIVAMSIGEDIVHGPSSYDVALVADFATLKDLQTYSTHPKHQVVLDISGPVKEHLAVADFEW